jgi:hypothetical protein
MGGVFTGFVLFGFGAGFGVVVCGGMKKANRQAARCNYIRMPGAHRLNPAPMNIAGDQSVYDKV